MRRALSILALVAALAAGAVAVLRRRADPDESCLEAEDDYAAACADVARVRLLAPGHDDDAPCVVRTWVWRGNASLLCESPTTALDFIRQINMPAPYGIN